MKKNVITLNIAVITAIVCAVSFAHPLYASTHDLDQTGPTNTSTSTDGRLPNTLTDILPVSPLLNAITDVFTPNEPATTTPAVATSTASTTPLISGELRTGDPINIGAETILNTVLPPKNEPQKVTRPSATSSATSTPVAGSTKSKNTTGTTNSTPEVVPEEFERTTNGESNVRTHANYYTPLDNLTPESTFALSFVAMILGIMGAVLILKEPSESPAWMPGLKTQESLLDS
ncbi:hypothetical protein H0W32_00040 [Patescibacteria group bacterium]|nr:hypothetical protein [Patescibacteria group bacterium]